MDGMKRFDTNQSGFMTPFGDFNVVLRKGERLNSHFFLKTATYFNKFIIQTKLHDFNMGGSKFMYFGRNGAKLSKLD